LMAADVTRAELVDGDAVGDDAVDGHARRRHPSRTGGR
jgi:hypothetical protein